MANDGQIDQVESGLESMLEDLRRREPIFHRPAFGKNGFDWEEMMAPDYWEVGASGRRYSREFVLDTLEARLPGDEDQWETRGFHCLEIAPDNYLVTYTLLQGARVTRRATLWRRTKSGWKVLYHQGTVVEAVS